MLLVSVHINKSIKRKVIKSINTNSEIHKYKIGLFFQLILPNKIHHKLFTFISTKGRHIAIDIGFPSTLKCSSKTPTLRQFRFN